MQITEFRASGAEMYGTALHRILVLWDHVWYNFHRKSDLRVKYGAHSFFGRQDELQMWFWTSNALPKPRKSPFKVC